MLIKWFGHSCFLVESSDSSVSILTDPFDKSLGYPLPDVSPTVVTESHQHFDHNAHTVLNGEFKVLKKVGTFEIDGVEIKGINSFHDNSMGKERGMNIIFRFEFPEGVSIAHFGDLGHVIGKDILTNLLPLDIVLIPVGGKFTIGPDEAMKVCDMIRPKVIIPMHYKTKYLNFPIKSVDDFLQLASVRIVRNKNNVFEFDPKDLKKSEPFILVMNI